MASSGALLVGAQTGALFLEDTAMSHMQTLLGQVKQGNGAAAEQLLWELIAASTSPAADVGKAPAMAPPTWAVGIVDCHAKLPYNTS